MSVVKILSPSSRRQSRELSDASVRSFEKLSVLALALRADSTSLARENSFSCIKRKIYLRLLSSSFDAIHRPLGTANTCNTTQKTRNVNEKKLKKSKRTF